MKLFPEILIIQELKNVFPCSDFSIVKKAVSSGEGRGHHFQFDDAHKLGNAGHSNGLDQDRLSYLLHIYKNTLHYILFNCCFNLPMSPVSWCYSALSLVKHLVSTPFYYTCGMLMHGVFNCLMRQDYHCTIQPRTKACLPCVLKMKDKWKMIIWKASEPQIISKNRDCNDCILWTKISKLHVYVHVLLVFLISQYIQVLKDPD